MSIDGQDILRCPRRPFLEEPEYHNNLFWLYGRYKEGHLPEDGGLRSQPYRLMELFKVIEHGSFLADEAEKEKTKFLASRTAPAPAPTIAPRRGPVRRR